MRKADYISLILGTVGALLFAFGMCMGLIPEWGMQKQGIVLGLSGMVIIAVMLAVRRNMLGKPPIRIDMATVGKALFGIFGAVVFGAGMCLVMVWGKMLPGIAVGIIGIALLLCLIPLCIGIKD